METSRLKSFAQKTRIELMGQVERKLDVVLAPESSAHREAPKAVAALRGKIEAEGRDMVIEQVAYTWFNRFTALRYMDANGYLTPMVVTPAPERTRPELLDQAVAGALPEYVRQSAASRIRDLLEGRAPSREPQVEAYRLLVVATCNHLHGLMPYMFEPIADFTELLMPDALLAPDGWVAQLREVMSEEVCQDVEIIGWLYQFYISEKKDQVFAALKKNKKIEAENIPAATQLFTPHWIVRYLVENSLGRLWLLNRPESKLAERMDYFIAPQEPETDFLKITKPEEIKVCDPACGSGHMLTYAFDLLYAIYEEEGYDPAEIPALILQHNLTGVEIDDRAGALAAFALAMKAAAKLGRRRFLRMEAKPDICVLQDVSFSEPDMQNVAAVVGKDLFTDELRETLGQFEQAKNFGSLIVPKLRDPKETLQVVEARDFGGDLLLKEVQERVVAVLRMAEALSPKYHVVVANPPYMGGKGMNGKLSDFAKSKYPDSKTDLFAMFMERTLSLSITRGLMAMINMQAWMFLSSLEKIRTKMLDNCSVLTMAHLGERAFDTIGGAVVSTTAFITMKLRKPNYRGDYVRLVDGASEAEKSKLLLSVCKGDLSSHKFHASPEQFMKIPGRPLVYWLPNGLMRMFGDAEKMGDHVDSKQGLATANNGLFMRSWHEVSHSKVGFNIRSSAHAQETKLKWFPINKGGPFRRWYGNHEFLVNWADNGREIREYITERYPYLNGNIDYVIKDRGKFFHESVSWSDITTGANAFRYYPAGFLYDATGHSAFCEDASRVLAFCNSKPCEIIARAINPTIHFHIGYFDTLPWPRKWDGADGKARVAELVGISRLDWDAYETSWDFTTLPLLSPDHRAGTLEETYARLRDQWQGMTDEMQRLEKENNRIFIDAYGLQDELTPDVPIEEITLTCNPAYRYGVKISEEEREKRLKADTMKELISYAIGCMFGRYSLDEPGLILANQGETLEDYLARVPDPSFRPDKDNVIPLLEDDRFEDDAYQRFREFLAVTFGEDCLVENLEFIGKALGKDVKSYLAKDFYADHVQRYKKRPIYWLISSPKGAFQALIYMHRYTPDTLNIALNDYVRSLRDKLEASRRAAEALQINPEASAAERNRAGREIDKLARQIAEITEWERDFLYPLAVERIEIDLDDGVKRNYPKFTGVLKPIKGLEAQDA